MAEDAMDVTRSESGEKSTPVWAQTLQSAEIPGAMIAELTAAQEDALLSDVADYLDEVQSEQGESWADRDPSGEESGPATPHGESWADRDPSEDESESVTPPGGRPSAEIEESMAPSTNETARGEYQSPGGKVYATKPRSEVNMTNHMGSAESPFLVDETDEPARRPNSPERPEDNQRMTSRSHNDTEVFGEFDERRVEAPRMDPGRRFQPRRGRGNPGRGGNRGRSNRNRYRGNTHWDSTNDAGRPSRATSSAAPVQLAPLSAAKGVIKSKLSVMFRGLRGIEAAQAAFELCGVDIGFHVNERMDQPKPNEEVGRNRHCQDRVPENSNQRQSGLRHSPTEPNNDPQE